MKFELGALDRRAITQGVVRRVAACGFLLALASASWGAAGIYSCVDSSGKKHTSDRPIPECLDREQRVLNKDGSQKQTVPPRMNAEERALAEERQHQKALAEAAQKDAIRRDRNLMLRYPNEAAHNKAREAVIDELRRGIEASELHLKELQSDRKPLLDDAEFYKGKRLPGKLKTRLEANEAQQQAQKDIITQQTAEIARVNALYDAELARLRRLWSGAAPGSGPVATPSSPH
ncbi:MAG TPA: DUF4124 domain-containing protein [Aquabacterium sp.]|uniref:DUF4124 domain-containing protein n=1 Tax=Aquabacterium sp. TaxID=1872578 RepID=UPI002E2FF11C|nr:DUF4124 domain-containing protein [Aquabacterium sp.]HEX5356002.1 DUF4124 domain-containing protein [Aquabacterium sp.]